MKLFFLLLPLMLVGCGDSTAQQAQEQAQWRSQLNEAARGFVENSFIQCADGNEVRVAVLGFPSNAQTLSAWTILDQDGKPKRCVRRVKAAAPQYEDVPQ